MGMSQKGRPKVVHCPEVKSNTAYKNLKLNSWMNESGTRKTLQFSHIEEGEKKKILRQSSLAKELKKMKLTVRKDVDIKKQVDRSLISNPINFLRNIWTVNKKYSFGGLDDRVYEMK